MLDFFTKKLQLHEPGHGIAYTTHVITPSQIIDNKRGARNTVQGMEEESMYKKLTVVVNRGMAEDVMDIARKSGVKGGTVIRGRGTGSECTAKILGMKSNRKRNSLLSLSSGLVDQVVNDLYKELKLDVPGNGILFVERLWRSGPV